MKLLILSLFTLNIYALPIKGELTPTKACISKNMGQLFVSKDKKLVYQIEMPSNGTFSLDLPSETFEFSFVMENGCNANKKITLKGKTKKISLEVKND